jgi:hypothetical protein
MSSFERKVLPDGKENPKYIDLCDEDQPIAGQKFTCISFISPEKILKQREQFIFEEFVKEWDFTKCISKTVEFMNFIAFKYKLKTDDLMADFQEFTKEEKSMLKESTTEDDFKTFMDKNEERLNEEFNKQHSFRTSVRGLKVRGVFNSQEEAELRCKKLRETDPNHDIYVGPVGIWIPWDPDAYKTGRVEFMEEELNQLHSEKQKNEIKAKEEFDRRIKDSKRKAIEDNIKLAEKTGNVLTQTIDEEGELTGVKDTIDFENREVSTEEETQEYNKKILEKALN